MGKYFIAWLLGVPAFVLLLVWMFFWWWTSHAPVPPHALIRASRASPQRPGPRLPHDHEESSISQSGSDDKRVE